MTTTIKPIIYKTEEKPGYLLGLREDIKRTMGKNADFLLEYPVVYIHVWQSANDKLRGQYKIYIGEADDAVRRQEEHWRDASLPKEKSKWQYKLKNDKDENGKAVIPTLYIIGHPFFTKSMTLDIEDKFIVFCTAMRTTRPVNGRNNPQRLYHGNENTDAIFSFAWNWLRKDNPELFRPVSEIHKSALYKASPNHKLTSEQKAAKEAIIDRVFDALINNKSGQLIMVEGEAGTGKTVLTSSTFYDLLRQTEDSEDVSSNLSVYLLVNHDEQFKVYASMAKQLGFGEDVVLNPTSFLNKHSIEDPTTGKMIPDKDPDNQVDVVFVDEAHLLWTQPKQSYKKTYSGSQLNDIIARSRVTVIMYDENQVLRKEQFEELNFMDEKRALAKSQGPDPWNSNPQKVKNNYIQLVSQLRMNCSQETMKWVDNLTHNLRIENLALNRRNKDAKDYEVVIFDNPYDLHEAIRAKASREETSLSRLIATYDWEYQDRKRAPEEQRYWKVVINYKNNGREVVWEMPWNEQRYWVDIEPNLNARQRRLRNELDWAEQDYSVDEVGSTFTIQGFDLSYAGVILGKSVHYNTETGMIEFLEKERAWEGMKGYRKMADGTRVNVTHTISMHEFRVLMTRGTKGLYIYACDENLRDALKRSIKKS